MENSKYFLGLDIGTNSVGWAVTDENYNILNFNGKKMWGIRLFNEGSTAVERRSYRAARRSRQRKIERSRLLRELFAEEVSKIDPNFFIRLRESDLYYEDKSIDSKGSLFNDDEWTDKKYHEKYPTIFHLIMDLINNDEKKDIRLVFLACNWLIKNRGHFLFNDKNFDTKSSLNNALDDLTKHLVEEPYDLEFNFDKNAITSILSSTSYGVKKKQEELKKFFGGSKLEKGIIVLISGGSQKLNVMFGDDELKNSTINSTDFKRDDIEENRSNYIDDLGERFELIEILKKIYDASILDKLMTLATVSSDGNKYISSTKVALYEKYGYELTLLKQIVKIYLPKKYYEVFRDKASKNNYVAYTKNTISSNKREKADKDKDFNIDSFYGYIKKILKEAEENNKNRENDIVFIKNLEYIRNEIENRTFLTKQRAKDNSLIPYQLKEMELKKILDNQSKYYDFLNLEEDGRTVKDKIVSLLTFRIPYYVGPLNPSHNTSTGNSWVVRKESGKVTPWNFEDKIDIEKSRELFIDTKLNTCSYVKDEIVLPKNSLLYREYMVLNELNNLKINGELVDDDLKKKIYEELFKNYKKVTQKRTIEFIKKVKNTTEDIVLTGIDGDFKQNLASYIDIKKIIGDKIEVDKYKNSIENIISDITLFGHDSKYIEEKIYRDYKDIFTDEEIKKLKNLRYSDWGRFSKKFLNGITFTNKETGETDTLIGFMRNYSLNHMELMSKRFTLLDEIDKINKSFITDEKFSYSMLDDLYLSPSVKRMLWQSLKIVKEVTSVMKCDPLKIFIEMARGSDGSDRKDSRKTSLENLYKNCKKDIIEILDNDENAYNKILNKIQLCSEADLRAKKLYLYYIQLGKCMYTLEDIDLSRGSIYDIDHIYPKSKLFDDSLENTVLVNKIINSEVKKNNYPIDSTVISNSLRPKVERFWKMLHDKGFIGNKKYSRLIRKTPFKKEELAGFIERQMVETRQASKETANLLKRICQDSEVVYVKAGNVSMFRQKFDLVKSRLVNDYHHAHDAYLNIVVGNVYDVKFTKDPFNYIINNEFVRNYNLEKLFDYDVERNGCIAWKANDEETAKPGSIANVKKNINNRNILFTRMSYEGKGELFKVNLLRKGKAKVPKKENIPVSNMQKYGGYSSLNKSTFLVVSGTWNKKDIKKLIPLTLIVSNKIKTLNKKLGEKILIDYVKEYFNIENPKILIKDIKVNTLLKIDGAFYHLRGGLFDEKKTGTLELRNAIQLNITKESYIIVKQIEKESKNDYKFVAKNKLINKENILNVFKELIDKFNNSIYRNSLIIGKKALCNLEASHKLFEKLDLVKQCEIIAKIITAMGCSGVNYDLPEIGLGTEVGRIRPLNVISNYGEFKIINQSITGLFENEVDLLKL